jgi:sugar phosphate isomerase/epimerase
VHPSISLNLSCLADVSLREAFDFCLDAGFHQVGIPWAAIQSEGLDRSVEVVLDSGLGVATLGRGAFFTLASPRRWPNERQSLITALDVAATLRAHTVYGHAGPAGGLGWDDAAEALTRASTPVVSHSHQVGVPLVIEQTNPLYADTDFVHSFRDAMDIAAMTGIGLCLDLFHIWEERHLLDNARRALPCLHLLQLGDFCYGTRQVPDRAVPGDGVMPIRSIVGGLVVSGYQGPIDLELLGERIRREGAKAAAVRAGQYMSDLLQSIGPDVGENSAP